jgi:hypothetical protein
LKRLVDDGYALEVRGAHLLVHDVPYVTSARQVARGTMVTEIDLVNDVTVSPQSHEMMFMGEHPHHADGRLMTEIQHGGGQQLGDGWQTDWSFSHKPVGTGRYDDYHHKVTSYAELISAPARQIDPEITARTYRLVEQHDLTSPFLYADTASSRAGLGPINAKITGARVAVVGVGGTGSYLLDLLARTPVAEIHLFDDDRFLQHNAFRSPGPTAGDELADGPRKVDLHARRWARMRRGVIAHPERVTAALAPTLATMDVTFVCVDSPASRREVIAALEVGGATFIDVGMSVDVVPEREELFSQLRVTTSQPVTRELARPHLPTIGDAAEDVYSSNIQVAELNALNACLALIRWKKLRGFYADTGHEHQSTYLVDDNTIVNTGEDS